MKQVIDIFDGEFAFLSNFSPDICVFEGIVFPTVEHAFQAAKTLDKNQRLMIAAAPTPGKAKRMGRNVSLRADWEQIKTDVMYKCLRSKFSTPELREQLLDTGDAELIEGNWWNDTTWGVCNGVGENRLGKLLMQIRAEIKDSLN